jgi:hypothetical protein
LAFEREVSPGRDFGGFEVEHFMPEAAAGQTTYHNLMWSCPDCNRKKGEWWPSREQKRNRHVLPNPNQHGFGRHVQIDSQTLEVSPKTPEGACLVTRLDLNSKVHLYRRTEREKSVQLLNEVRTKLEEQGRDATEIQELVARLAAKLGPFLDEPPAPADVSGICACATGLKPGTA